MPALVIEDGTRVLNANSYVSVVEADDYFSTHPFYSDNWEKLGVPDKESVLLAATATLDALIRWRGLIVSTSQGLAWPRTGVVDDEGRRITSSAIPQRVKNAVFEMAFFLSRGDPYAASSSAGVERLKIDVIELQFASSTVTAPVPAAVLVALRGLGEYALGSRVRKVLVG